MFPFLLLFPQGHTVEGNSIIFRNVEFSYFLSGKWMSVCACVMGAVSFPAGEQRREDSRGDRKEKIGNIQE